MVRLVGVSMWLAACTPQTPTALVDTVTPQLPVIITPTDTLATTTALPTASPTPGIDATVPIPSPDAITAQNVDRLRPVAQPLGHAGYVYGVAISADNKLVATASLDYTIRVFDSTTAGLIYTLKHHRDSAFCVAFSLDGKRLVSGGRDGTVQLWDMATGERISGTRTAGFVFRLAVSPHGAHFASISHYSARGQVWDMASGSPVFPLEDHHTRLRSVAYSPDGRYLATGDEDDVVILRDPSTGQPLRTLTGSGGEARSIAFSPDGQYLAVGTSLSKIDLWNLEEQSYEGWWFAHSAGVWGLAFSADGSLIISAGADGALRFWDATTGRRLRTITYHSMGVRDMALSPDGSTLVSGAEDRRVVVWRIVY